MSTRRSSADKTSSAAWREIIRAASHELRAPLALIYGYVETLQDGHLKGAAPMQRCLDIIGKQSRRMMRIVEDMHTLAMMDGGPAEHSEQSFQLHHCVQDALEHLSAIIDLHHAEVLIQLPENDLVSGNRQLINLGLVNLLETILLRNTSPGLIIHVSGEWLMDRVIILIKDNGLQYTAEDLANLFKPFHRSSHDDECHSRGTGMSLALASRAFAAQGGNVVATQATEVGVEFVITLPNLIPPQQEG
jgi:signal transduction histidine kinase